MTSVLQVLAHGPATRYQLAFLVGRTPDEVSDEIFDQFAPERLVEMDEANVWSITDAGRETLRLIEAYESGRRRDAQCVGISARGRSAAGEGRS